MQIIKHLLGNSSHLKQMQILKNKKFIYVTVLYSNIQQTDMLNVTI